MKQSFCAAIVVKVEKLDFLITKKNNKNYNPTVQATYLGGVSLSLSLIKFCYCDLLIRNTVVGVWGFRENLPLRSIRP